MQHISKQTGTYILILKANSAHSCCVGKMGLVSITKGFYLYVGSAFGRGGVQARVSHHQKISLHPHWHIDYLRQQLSLLSIWCSHDAKRREHQWASLLNQSQGMTLPFPRFGASDCTCPAHLFFSPTLPSFTVFQSFLMVQYPEHAPILQYVL
ncbi:GIY-YIG nuclease family protein [Beggiatoa leptomitoformis]|uniref:DUF123 domain-containing protein n=1 Tax=Beggiatoa leptomitoformis TaxID=288004 RepID=A0A2N9YJ95_9GAMM|nr:GIY-YIG nuclease family protein [Beggiatoa leptomitoformis]ALG68497.1 DUF123 domain-containing protein [Beggiatoa leptomitoformis]AUI70601.2 DUF123 domain-containing protein [Beggiatoa leptomitoformis]